MIDCKHEVRTLLETNNLPTKKPFNCLNPNHEDRHPSMSYNSKNDTVHCFACGATYDTLDVIGYLYNIPDYQGKLKKAKELFGEEFTPNNHNDKNGNREDFKVKEVAHQKDYSSYFKIFNEDLNSEKCPGAEYLKSRGISLSTANRFDLGYVEDTEYPPRSIVIPTSNSSYVKRNIDKCDKRGRYRAVGGKDFFNIKAFEYNPKYVFVSEGELDALSFEEIGLKAIGLGSANNVEAFIDFMRDKSIHIPLILALDNDDAGKDATNKLSEYLDTVHIPYYIFNDFGNSKDPNEALVNNKEKFTDKAYEAVNLLEKILDGVAEEYMNTYSVYSHRKAFEYRMANKADSISTGFPYFDKSLGGGLYQGVYVIGAVTSLGKTTFISQMAEQLSKERHDVMYFSFEMSEDELISKGISRNTCVLVSNRDHQLSQDLKLSKNEVDNLLKHPDQCSGIQLKVLNAAKEDFYIHSKNMCVVEGRFDVYDVERRIKKHIELTGNKPIIFIDYLQIMKPARENVTEKMNVDIAISKLKEMSKKWNLTIIVLSSFNRGSYNEPVSMASFKESGGIEYWVDCAIGLQFHNVGSDSYDEKKERNKVPREIDAVILKNRHAATGVNVKYSYYAKDNYFFENLDQK